MDKTPQNHWSLNPLRKHALPALLLLLLNLGITAAFCFQFKEHMEEHAVKEFSLNSAQISLRIQERLWSYAQVLRGGAGLFAANKEVTREDWHTYVERLAPQKNLPGVQGIGFAKLLTANEMDTHIAAIRNAGFPNYSVFPPGQRALYGPIIYLEPFRDRNLRAFGYDMYAEPVRRQAMQQARDSGQPALSGKVELVQETGQQVQAGVLIYTPVYHNGLPTDTPAQRQQALNGWVYSPYRMHDLMADILHDWQQQLYSEIALSIYAGNEIKAESLLFSNTGNPSHHHDSIFFQQRQVGLNGSNWLLVFDHQNRFSSLTYLPVWLALLSGLLISGLIYTLTLNWLNTKAKAEYMARQLSDEIIAKQQLLTESELRSKLALEGSSLGLWDWNIETGTVYFSPLWKTMLGYQEEDISNQLSEWESRIHPDDLAATLATVQACLAGHSASYNSEHRIRCKDGSYKWILDRGTVVSHNADGKPLRMLGTHSDITERKLTEHSLLDTQFNLLEAQRIAQVGNWSMDLASGKVSWSAEIYRLFGLDQADTPPTLAEQEQLYTPEGWQQLSEAIKRCIDEDTSYELDLEVLNPDGNRQWMFVRGETVHDSKGNITGLQGTVANITAKKRDQLRIEQLGRLYNALSACNNAIVHCTSEEALFASICRIVVELGSMKMAWIGLIDENTGKILPVNCYGNGTDYLEGIHISIDASLPEGRGATGTATRENKPYWIEDFNNNPVTLPWRERAARYGWVSSAALPICRNNRPVGALTFYSAENNWFSAEIRSLLEEMAADISFALDKLASEHAAKEHLAQLTEAEQRFRCVVEQSITGAHIIQNEKIVYANPRLAEMLGYSNNDELVGISIFDLIATKDHERVKLQGERLRKGEIKQTETTFALKRKDGQLINVGSSSSLGSYRQEPAIIGIIQDTSSSKVAEQHIRRYVQQLENIFIQTVGLATTLSEMRDPYTAGHEQRVAEIAVAIGKEMGLDENTLEGLRVGCYLHDVGKMRVPIDILSKPGKLTASEYALIQEHAQAGYDVLKDVEFPWPVAQIALQHHERMDGSGYPQGLKGKEILLEARIAAVADVIESMAAHRPYRASVGLEKALAEIERGSGSAYDSDVVNACLRLFRDKGYSLTQ